MVASPPDETPVGQEPSATDSDPVAAPPRADIGGLIIAGVVLFVATLGLGRWLWGQIATSATRAMPLQRLVGWLGIVGAVVFTASWIIGGLLQDDHSERREYISALGAPGAESAWVMVGGFFVAGATVLLLAFAGHAGLRNCGVEALGPAVALGLVGATLFELAVLRSDCSRVVDACASAPTSWHHDWHTVMGWLAVVGMVAAALWSARLFSRASPLRHLARWSALFGVLTLLGSFFLAELIDDNGLTQRVFLLGAAMAVGHLGWRLIRLRRLPTDLGLR